MHADIIQGHNLTHSGTILTDKRVSHGTWHCTTTKHQWNNNTLSYNHWSLNIISISMPSILYSSSMLPIHLHITQMFL